MSGDIHIRIEGRAGRITLNRPEVLNALTHDMVKAMTRALTAWAGDAAVELVVVDAIGGRAFCAGGDIQTLYHEGRSHPESGRGFWRDEYSLNALIHHYPKPYVALMDGIVMGGGVGISAHGSHRIVTERSTVTMPETSIGFMPDVGGTRLLADAPGQTGFYLGLTATRMAPGDAIHAGFADTYVPSEKLPGLTEALKQDGIGVIPDFVAPLPSSKLAGLRPTIDLHFGESSVSAIAASLEAADGAWERETLEALRRVSPFSAAAAFEALRRARQTQDIESCLITEYRFAWRSLDGHDFFEGIRAAVIDKDRKPKWQPARIEDVTQESVAAVLAPLDGSEWRKAA
ncbi:MAG: enoyl-CoA hydratase/isomerase family protein [Aestuariivirga sp.]